ncbi:MAG TPA: hypothetical protein VIF10_17290 [Methylobacter sp.]|jgi:hypothetical protein
MSSAEKPPSASLQLLKDKLAKHRRVRIAYHLQLDQIPKRYAMRTLPLRNISKPSYAGLPPFIDKLAIRGTPQTQNDGRQQTTALVTGLTLNSYAEPRFEDFWLGVNADDALIF